MPVKVTNAILDVVEQADAWQNWISGMSPQALESLNPTPHNIFMRFEALGPWYCKSSQTSSLEAPTEFPGFRYLQSLA